MAVTTDRNDPGLKNIGPDGMQEKYLVLSEEERAKGFIRPVRRTYKHVGARPKYPLRDLTADEKEDGAKFGYVKYEEYPESESPVVGRSWTQAQFDSGCGAETTMGTALAETYAREPTFYGATMCSNCKAHFRVGADGEFVWVEKDGSLGPRVGT